MRAAILLILGSCLSLQEPEPRLSVSACSYYDACVPGFTLAFPGVDACIETLDAQPELLDRCGAGEASLDACRELIDEAQPACDRIDDGACIELLSCGSTRCLERVGDLITGCPGAKLDGEVIAGFCTLPGGSCVVDCLASNDCYVLGGKLLEVALSACVVDQCRLLSQ